mmetsp:Transcript_32430/g.27393  ORF Transcript_32430/g.27393 Transcript_32430/m.27393 type:complete len:86 (+) Transcript_32430:239-496(+)
MAEQVCASAVPTSFPISFAYIMSHRIWLYPDSGIMSHHLLCLLRNRNRRNCFPGSGAVMVEEWKMHESNMHVSDTQRFNMHGPFD